MITISQREWNEMKSILLDIRKSLSTLTDEAGKELLTPSEVCEKLKISRSTYQRYVEAGVIRQTQIGSNNSRVYVKRSVIDQLIDDGKI